MEKTRSLALAAMVRERGDEREERGLVRWLAMALTVGLVTVGPAMVAG